MTLRGSRLARRWLVVAVASLALIVGWALPASALDVVVISDGFENPATWTAHYDSHGLAEVTNDLLAAHSGQYVGYLVQHGPTEAATLDRSFSSPPRLCKAYIWVKATSTSNGHIKFNLEVLNPATNADVVSRLMEFSNSSAPVGWTQYVVGLWQLKATTPLLFRVSLYGANVQASDGALVDDLQITCNIF